MSQGCANCGKELAVHQKKFCGRPCYFEGCKRGLVANAGWFKAGHPLLNKGRTLESWVGAERAAAIRKKMSDNSRKKGDFLRSLNADKSYLERRRRSRRFHDDVVLRVAEEARKRGVRAYITSEYVKDARTPDAILFDGVRLVAVEIEQEKRYKPSHRTMIERLSNLNLKSGFFDETKVAFVSGSSLDEAASSSIRTLLSKD